MDKSDRIDIKPPVERINEAFEAFRGRFDAAPSPQDWSRCTDACVKNGQLPDLRLFGLDCPPVGRDGNSINRPGWLQPGLDAALRSRPTDEMMERAMVKRGEGPYQSAMRLLGKDSSHEDRMALVRAFQAQYREETGNNDPELRNLPVGHRFLTEKNFAWTMAKIADRQLRDRLTDRMMRTGGEKSAPESNEARKRPERPDRARERPDTEREGLDRGRYNGSDRRRPGDDTTYSTIPKTDQSGLNEQFNEYSRQSRGGRGRVMERLSDGSVYFRAGMAIDADGAPDARRIDPHGQLKTSLRYEDGSSVNARNVPYFVLPMGRYQQFGVKPGDVAAVRYNGKVEFAVFADVGPAHKLGEGSMALAERLGINPNPRNGGVPAGVEYIVFPRSGNGRPQTPQQIANIGRRLLGRQR